MNKKQIIFPVEIKAVNHPRSYILQKAFTNDLNSVELVFKLTDCTTSDLTGATASILLFMRDGSFFQDIPTITGTDVKYTLTEAQGNHAGVAQAQLIVKSGTNEWASDKQKFEIVAGLETVVATEVMIKDWTMLTAEARAYLDDAQAAEAARAATFGQWADTQADWAAAEMGRSDSELIRRIGYAQIENRISAGVDKVQTNYKKLEYPSGFTGTFKPFNIFYNNKNAVTDFDPNTYKIGTRNIYVSANGDPLSSGISELSPTTLENIRTKIANGDRLILGEGIHYITNNANITNKNAEIVGTGNTFIVLGSKHTYTNSDGYWTTSATNVSTVFDIVTKIEFTKALSAEEIRQYQYFESDGVVTINAPYNPNDRIIVLEDSLNRNIMVYNTNTFTTVYIENVTLYGGARGVFVFGAANFMPTVVLNGVHTYYAKSGIECEYGNIIINNCASERCYGDAITYSKSNFIEVNSVGANCTETDTHVTNGSTAHTYSTGIRVGGLYYNNEGANIADTNNCQSICVCCTANISAAKDRDLVGGHATGVIAENNTSIWLINCTVKGNVKDIVRSGETSSVYVMNCDYDTGSGLTTL